MTKAYFSLMTLALNCYQFVCSCCWLMAENPGSTLAHIFLVVEYCVIWRSMRLLLSLLGASFNVYSQFYGASIVLGFKYQSLFHGVCIITVMRCDSVVVYLLFGTFSNVMWEICALFYVGWKVSDLCAILTHFICISWINTFITQP